MRPRVIVGVLPLLGVAGQGLAQTRAGDILRPAFDSKDADATSHAKSAQLTATTGFAIALADYSTHGVAFPVRVGADLPLLQTGPIRHHLLLSLEWARFSRMFINEPEVVPGLQLDVASVRAAWVVYPFSRRGLHVVAGTGVSVLHDRIRLAVLDRHIASSQTTAGLAGELGLGWTVGRHVDVRLLYSHIVALAGGSAALGQPELVVGVRF